MISDLGEVILSCRIKSVINDMFAMDMTNNQMIPLIRLSLFLPEGKCSRFHQSALQNSR